MGDEIVLAGISRRDGGSAADGIHLLWSPPRGSGHSIGGFDIFRRKAQRTKISCHTLSQAELAQLHAQFELTIPIARIGVRRSACPAALVQSPTGVKDRVSRSIDFAGLPVGRAKNPFNLGDLVFQVSDRNGNPARAAEIVAVDSDRGLRIASRLVITLPPGVTAARLSMRGTGTNAAIEGVAPDGTILQAKSLQTKDGRIVASVEAAVVGQITVQARRGSPVLLGVDIELHESELSNAGAAPAAVLGPAAAATPLPSGIARLATNPVCLCYEIDFNRRQRFVQVTIRINAVLAIAMRGGKAVASRLLVHPEGVLTATFSEAAIDQVLLYVFGAAGGLTVCADVPSQPEAEEDEWRDAKLIAKGVDFPLTTLQPALGGPAGELALAKSRLLPGEAIDEAQFQDVAKLLNEVAATAPRHAPVLATLLERERVTDPFVELRPWPYGLSLTIDAAWRRVLGCGHLDPASDLEPGESYDYRIVGRFRRRDVQERLYGLHDLPSGTDLPPAFHLGPVLLRPQAGAVVAFGASASGGALHMLGRKGVRLTAAPGTESLSIAFDQPISRLALEIDPEDVQTLSYEARPSEFLLGASGALFTAILPKQPRIELAFAEPIDRLRLKGSGFFVGVRLLDHPPGTGPDEIVRQSAVVLGLRFEATAPPPPPLLVETENLQRPLTGGDVLQATEQGFKEIGFQVRWAPPEDSNLGATPLPWPGDIATLPPTIAAGFHIERRRVDTGEPFQEMDGQAPPTLFVGNRVASGAPPTLRTGADLAAVYTDVAGLDPPQDRLMDVEDVLIRAETTRAPPGSVHQYRVFSVDAIGRRSTSARLGPETRLEKHRPPPRPRGPTGERPAFAPVGVSARFLQASDPDLTDADRSVLADSASAIVIDWGWTDRERALDPFAREFRIYYQPNPPDIIAGTFTTDAVASGGGFAIQATLNQPVAAGAMSGAYLNAGGYPFKVAAHGAGNVVAVQLDAALLQPAAVPAQGTFELLPKLDGAELRPAKWDNRVAVVPITAATNYRFILRDPVQLNAARPRMRVWVGVASADGEDYVPDEIPAAASNGGRAGNESSIAAVAVSGRYFGRPAYTPPPPLAAVPELVTSEPAGAAVTIVLDLDVLLSAIPIPAGHGVALERVATHDLAPLLRAGADDRVGVTFPDGGATTYTLANPQDQADFLGQIRSGNPALIEGRFFLDLLQRFAAQLASLWQGLGAPVPPTGQFVHAAPVKPERYFHRVRVADAANRLSSAGAILPQVVRTPSVRAPGAPDVTVPDGDGEVLEIGVRVRAAYDLTHVLAFAQVTEQPPDPATIAAAELLRLPNRRDLPIADGLRLRLADGTMLAAAAVAEVADATLAPPDALLTVPLTVGHDRHVAIWCVSLTRDRIPSPPSGPHLAQSGQAPIPVPTLSVTRQDGADVAVWDEPAALVQVSLERSHDGGGSWQRASPWLPSTVTQRSMPTADGPRLYRLLLRGSRGAPTAGPSVSPTA
jgi:hypothetical protein